MKNSLKKILAIALPIFIGLVAFDIVTKYVTNIYLIEGEGVVLIPGLFNAVNVHNYGAAWGSMSGMRWALVAITIAFIAIFSYIYYKERNSGALFHVASGFIFAGCIGNLFDRLVFGYVRDMIQFAFWTDFPVFNIADICICVGVVLIIIHYIIYWVKTSKKKKKEGEDGNSPS